MNIEICTGCNGKRWVPNCDREGWIRASSASNKTCPICGGLGLVVGNDFPISLTNQCSVLIPRDEK